MGPCRASSSEAYRFARSAPRGTARRLHPAVGLLSWGSSIRPSADIAVLRPLPSEPSSRLRPETATFRARSVLAVPPGFNGLLRRGTVRRPHPRQRRGFVAPRSRPWGSPRFQLLYNPSAARDPRRSLFEAFPDGEYPSKPFPLRQPDHASPPLPLSKEWRSPNGVPFRRWAPSPPLCHHRFRGMPSTVGRCSAGRVRRGTAVLPLRSARCSHGLWIAHVPMPAAFFRTLGGHPTLSPRGSSSAAASPHPRVKEGKESLALSGSERVSIRPGNPKVPEPTGDGP